MNLDFHYTNPDKHEGKHVKDESPDKFEVKHAKKQPFQYPVSKLRSKQTIKHSTVSMLKRSGIC